MSILSPNSLKNSNITMPLAVIGHVNDSNNDENEIFKILIDSSNEISKLRQFIFYVGTSCDGRSLRHKLKKLQEILYHNILKQKESIFFFFNRSKPDKNYQSPTFKIRDSELIRFTLTSLSYFESLIQRLIYLLNAYPLEEHEKIDMTVNLGFEDSAVDDNEDESYVKNEIKDNEILPDAHLKENLNRVLFPSISLTKDIDNFKNYLVIVQKLIEEIEQLDVNLLRFNIKASETNEFFKSLKEMNKSNSKMRNHRRNSVNSKGSSDEEAAGVADPNDKTNKKKKKHSNIKTIKNSTIKELCNRRQVVYTLLITGLIFCVIAVVCGLVFGLKQ